MVAKFRDQFLPLIDLIGQGLPNMFGLRQYDVSLSVVAWTGSRPGLGTNTVATYPITVNQNKAGNNRPKVAQLSTREVLASAGLYVEGDYRIGPLTPHYVTVDGYAFGTLPGDIEKALQTNPQEIFFNLNGPGMSDPTGGDWFKLVKANFANNFHYDIVIRKTAQKPF